MATSQADGAKLKHEGIDVRSKYPFCCMAEKVVSG